MKNAKFYVLGLLLVGGIIFFKKVFKDDAYFESEGGITSLIDDIKDNYGDTPAFNSILLSYDEDLGNLVVIQANNDITSNKLIEKQFLRGEWQDKSEITMELESGKMEDFLFTLSEVDLNKIPELVKDAKERVSKEKGIADIIATSVSVVMPSRVSNKLEDLDYSIAVEPKNGGTSFSLTYDLSGKFIDMRY